MSGCPAAGSKAAAVPEVERVWFPPGAATGTGKSEGSLMRAQGGLQTRCPCPSTVVVAQHDCSSLAPLCQASPCCVPLWLCGSPAGGAEGPSVSLSHPWAHRFLTPHSRHWGSSRHHHSAGGVSERDPPARGAPDAEIPFPSSWCLEPPGPIPELPRSQLPAQQDTTGVRNAKVLNLSPESRLCLL